MSAQHTQAPPTERERELLALLMEAQELGLTFHIGSAYISRGYIDAQERLIARIDAISKAVGGAA